MRIFISMLLTVSMTLSVNASAQQSGQQAAKQYPKNKTITFGVVPQQAANVLANVWVPLTQYLSAETGLTVKFATAKNIPNFEQRLSENAYDIAYMNPFHYIYFSEYNEYHAIAKQANKQIKGILVARKDSNIKTIQDLHDKTLAFPAPAAFAASILPRAELELNEVNFTPRYVSSHDSVYLNVSKGFFVAGGGVMRTFNNMPEEVRDQLKIFWNTQPYTPHAVAASPSLSVEDTVAIQSALENLHTTDIGREILKNLGMDAFVIAHDTDWDDVRNLNISKEHVKAK
ncbi:MAG: phosphate/phosphite/phosphonate ABC transporter substrate-binding protein [Glaciecola sp.]|nr:phosphate/phosphite/phosphonate ABC transporter substrate-binding protein [Glaciecola sp.]MDG1814920.1 phosphate/phosphite/phosphonate ABC transporter substrate-binding protein [Glaciecola sp.]MDG2100184.1 phosphate/phosphite/phosphonate ABC transporter substrate-binding protein [Glaciecola sp.]